MLNFILFWSPKYTETKKERDNLLKGKHSHRNTNK